MTKLFVASYPLLTDLRALQSSPLFFSTLRELIDIWLLFLTYCSASALNCCYVYYYIHRFSYPLLFLLFPVLFSSLSCNYIHLSSVSHQFSCFRLCNATQKIFLICLSLFFVKKKILHPQIESYNLNYENLNIIWQAIF